MRGILVCVWLLAACGTEYPAAPVDAGLVADAIPPGQRLLPLTVGGVWTWRVTPGSGAPFTKTATVEALDAVDGVPALRIRTQGADEVTVSWQEDTGSAVRRLREQSFAADGTLLSDVRYLPYRLRLDESNDHLMLGATWVESYTEVETKAGVETRKSKSEQWTIEALAQSVTVPAGTFACVRVRRAGTEAGASSKTYWFAPGVGKVKEAGGQTEELATYPPPAP